MQELKEWATAKNVKQTKLPKTVWVDGGDGFQYAFVRLKRDKDGCVVMQEPVELSQIDNQKVL